MKKIKIFKSLLFGGLSAGVIAGSVGAVVACSTTSTAAATSKLMSQSATNEVWDGYSYKDFMTNVLQTPEGQQTMLTSQAQLLIYEWYKNNTLNDTDGQANYRAALTTAQGTLDSAVQSAKDTYRTDWENNHQKNTLDKNGGSSENYLKYKVADSLKTTFVNAMFSDLKFGLLQQPTTDEFKKYGPRVSIPLSKVIPDTVTAADVASTTIKYGFAPTGEYNTDTTGTGNSLYSYVGNTYKLDQLKAAFQSYVFDQWFARERPVVVKTALFKYEAPSAGATAIYPAVKYGTSTAAGLNFPMFADENVNSTTKGAEAAYTSFMDYAANVPSQDQHVVIPLSATMDTSTTIIGTLKDLFTTYGTAWAASVLGITGTALSKPDFVEPTTTNRHALIDNFLDLTSLGAVGTDTNNEVLAKAVDKNQTLTTHFKSSNGWVIAPDEFGIHVSTMDRLTDSASATYDWSDAGLKESQQVFLLNLLRGTAGDGKIVNENETVSYDLLGTLKTYMTNNFDTLLTGFASTSDTSAVPAWTYSDASTNVKTFADIKNMFYLAGGLTKEGDTTKNDILTKIDLLTNYNNTLIQALQKFSWITSYDHVIRTKIGTVAQTANNNAFTGGATAYKNGLLASFDVTDSKALYAVDSTGAYTLLNSRAPSIMTAPVTVDFAALTAYIDAQAKPGYLSANSELLVAKDAILDYAMFELRANAEYANIVKYYYVKNKIDDAVKNKTADLYSTDADKGNLSQDDAAYQTIVSQLTQLADFQSNTTKSEFGFANTDFKSVLSAFVQYSDTKALDTESNTDSNVVSTVDRKEQAVTTTIAYLLQPAVDSNNKTVVVNGKVLNNYQQILLSNLLAMPLSTRFTEVWNANQILPNGNPNGMYGYNTVAANGLPTNTYFSYSGSLDVAYGSTSNVVYSPDKTLAGLGYIGGSAGDIPAKVNSVLFAQANLLATLAANYGTIGIFSSFASRAKVNDYVTQMIAAYDTGGHAFIDAFIQQLRTSLGLLLTDASQSSLTTDQRSKLNAALTDALSQYAASDKQTSLTTVLDLLDAAATSTNDGIKYNGKPISLYSGAVTSSTVIKAPTTTDFLGDGTVVYKVTAANDQALLSYETIMNDYSVSALGAQLKKPLDQSYQFIKDLMTQAANATTQSAAIRYFLANHGKYTGQLTTDERDATKAAGTETNTIHDRTIYEGLGSSDYVRGYGDI